MTVAAFGAAVLWCVVPGEAGAGEGEGEIDVTFGNSGATVVDHFFAVAMAPHVGDGIIMAGQLGSPDPDHGTSLLALTRVGADGEIDTEFGDDGLALTTFSNNGTVR